MQKTAVIIPCYNEAGRIRPQEFLSFAHDNPLIDFIFVDDGSTDNTLDIIREMSMAGAEKIHVLNLPDNSGKAEAIRQGFLKAFAMNYDFLGYWDADLSTPLSEIKTFVDIMRSGTADIILGSRIKLLGRDIKRHMYRHYAGRIFATAASMTLNLPVYDTQCGAKLFRNTGALKTVFSKPFLTDWVFDVEILARFILLEKTRGGLSLTDSAIEHPLEKWSDIPGSKIGVKGFLTSSFDLLKILLFLYLPGRKKRSDHFFITND